MQPFVEVIISFFDMGGYGSYVFASYAAMLTIFFLCLLGPLRQYRRIKTRLRSKS